MIVSWYRTDILSRIRLAGVGSAPLMSEMVQPAQSCPSSQMTGGFLPAASRAWTTFSRVKSSDAPSAAVTPAHYFRKSRLVIVLIKNLLANVLNALNEGGK